jgi:hypothetical protein
MSMTHRLLIPGLVGVCALVSCTENPYDTEYDPYGRNRYQQPLYGTRPANPSTNAYGTPQTPSPYGSTAPYGNTAPYGTPNPGTPSPSPYGSLQPPPSIEPPVTPPPATGTPGNYPVAEKTKTPGFVISPYDPDKVIDVSEFRSGQLVKDPDNKKIFRVP